MSHLRLVTQGERAPTPVPAREPRPSLLVAAGEQEIIELLDRGQLEIALSVLQIITLAAYSPADRLIIHRLGNLIQREIFKQEGLDDE